MRRPVSQTRIAWSADIPSPDHAALKALLPFDGSFPWLMRTSLGVFLPIIESNQYAVEYAHKGVEDFMSYRRSRPDEALSNVSCQIPRDYYERFNKLLPEWGSTTWYIRTVVRAFIVEMEPSPLTDHVERTVKSLWRQA